MPHLCSWHSNCPLSSNNPASLSGPLLSHLFLAPSLFVSLSPLPPQSSSCFFIFAMPQGPPGPQGSPHPQPPPPNSMMGPHSQVTLPHPLFFCLFLSGCCHSGTLVLSADASCYGICLSLMLAAAYSNHSNVQMLTIQ